MKSHFQLYLIKVRMRSAINHCNCMVLEVLAGNKLGPPNYRALFLWSWRTAEQPRAAGSHCYPPATALNAIAHGQHTPEAYLSDLLIKLINVGSTSRLAKLPAQNR